jgi:cytidylate kinase
MVRKIITIDGLAGSGKTSISKALAEKIGYIHFSTGLLYRTIGYLALEANLNIEEPRLVSEFLNNKLIKLINENNSIVVLVNNQKLSADLHIPKVSEITSKVSEIEIVRKFLLPVQKEALPDTSFIAEGRDMGTVVFPDADLKFFIEVSLQTRVERRLKQLERPNMSENERNSLIKQMEVEITERDNRDTNRSISPTVAASDAIIIKNEAQTLTQIVEKMYDLVAKAGLLTS